MAEIWWIVVSLLVYVLAVDLKMAKLMWYKIEIIKLRERVKIKKDELHKLLAISIN